MHAGGMQITRIDLTKGDKEHQKNQRRLYDVDKFVDKWFRGCQHRNVHKNEVGKGTGDHG